jgi:hypothetical protein
LAQDGAYVSKCANGATGGVMVTTPTGNSNINCQYPDAVHGGATVRQCSELRDLGPNFQGNFVTTPNQNTKMHCNYIPDRGKP